MKSFNRHPPLGVNATLVGDECAAFQLLTTFQWAPTLGGECYCLEVGFGVVAQKVSMGTHPWG